MGLDRKLTFFIFVFLYGTVASFSMAGATAIASTTLTSGISATALAIEVKSTDRFLAADAVFIDNEVIEYTSRTATTFIIDPDGRGARGTDAEPHGNGSVVQTGPMGIVNQLVGFRIMDIIADDGLILGGIQVVAAMPGFFVNSIMKLMLWDFEFLNGHGIWLKLPLWALSAGLGISFISWAVKRG